MPKLPDIESMELKEAIDFFLNYGKFVLKRGPSIKELDELLEFKRKLDEQITEARKEM
ncbi:hypothetical protein [uncultured Metabacillus sp.]|uniref:hypothetical protein n=1 Tax=uncultured Metabacillus sp. TaxID=2860135 RepID=UPI002634B03E|nr:hypothetical protein [uncultured Metabacillus sp.]